MGRMLLFAAVCGWAVLGAQADDTEPVSVHQMALEAHRDVPTSADLIGDRASAVIPLTARGENTRPCATIFGYLPYWCSSTYIHWDLLTHVACFSLEVNSSGNVTNAHGWPWTSLVNTAHANGVKVILVATLFDDSSIYTLITTPSYKQNFFTNMKARMLAGGADGLNIDFEGNASSWKPYINTFMADLTAYMHAEIPGSEVTFAGPSVNWSGWNLPGLAASCDGIFIMGYAFWGSWSSTSGPNSPLTGGTYNITSTVLSDYGTVTQNNPEKLILGLPYYGHHWTTTTSSARSSVIDFIASSYFYNDQPNSQSYGLLWDSTSQTAWYRYQSGSTWHQVWFDNATSLGLKYDLAIANNLQGVGMWALGYDGSRPELWDLLEEKFGGCTYCCDYTGDGHVTVADWPYCQFCLAGPDVTYGDTHLCRPGDTDDDADVDLHDFARFQASYQG